MQPLGLSAWCCCGCCCGSLCSSGEGWWLCRFPSLEQQIQMFLQIVPVLAVSKTGLLFVSGLLQLWNFLLVKDRPVRLCCSEWNARLSLTGQKCCLTGCPFLTGMLALEMLGRRAHNDHPNNFSRSPPYTEDVKWLLGLAAKLGKAQSST